MDALLPNLIIAGVSKGGSTALADYLGQHGEICHARTQEVFYALARGASEPELAPYFNGYRHFHGEQYLCEHGATYYFGGSAVIEAIKTNRPDARILMTVRDPVKRLWSAYNYKKSKFRLPRDWSFEEFVTESERRFEAGIDTVPDSVWRELAIGFYDRTIVPWLNAFGDRICVVFFEQWTRDPAPVLRQLCQWLDVATEPVADFDYSTHNKTVLHRSRVVKNAAYAANRRVAYALAPSLRKTFRRIYYTFNAEQISEQMSPEIGDRVRKIYQASNAALARALEVRGYETLPEWLEESAS